MTYQTWGDIKLATLQKMFASKGTTLNVDSSTEEYIYSMPQAANEALQMLATAGKFILDSLTIIVQPLNNLLAGDEFQRSYVMFTEPLVFKADGAKSYYFRANGYVNVSIFVGENLVKEIAVASNETYDKYKGVIANPDNETVRMVFYPDYPSNIKNVALYPTAFVSDEAVPDNEDFVQYRLDEILPDFYQLSPGDIYYEGNREPKYLAADKYYQEAGKTLVLRRDMPGSYTVYYKKYPQTITIDTPDDYELVLDPEVSALLPLYMASQLYKDDDNSISTVYRNEFEVAFERLIVSSQSGSVPRREEFVSETGWTS